MHMKRVKFNNDLNLAIIQDYENWHEVPRSVRQRFGSNLPF